MARGFKHLLLARGCTCAPQFACLREVQMSEAGEVRRDARIRTV
jgi:hypothetical protein